MSMLAVHDLSLMLRGRRILEDIDVTFRSGRVTALLGANGAGKSMLLSCLAALRHPGGGQVTLDGDDVHRLERRARARRIGLLPQAQDVHWDVEVETLVELGRLPWRGRWGSSDADRDAVDRAIAATDLEEFRHRHVEHLSGGERSRVLLARVLAGEPEWLLADEPLASLDPAHQLDVLARLRSVADAGAGVLLVVHDLNLAGRIADDAVLLRKGQVVAAGNSAEVLTPARIEAAYGVSVEIGETAGGQRYILPAPRA